MKCVCATVRAVLSAVMRRPVLMSLTLQDVDIGSGMMRDHTAASDFLASIR